MVARRLGRYRLREELGRGGMAVVYKAEDTRLHRTVALKVLSSTLVGDRRALGRFRREAQAIAQLNHPHVVQVYDVDQVRGQHFIAMEYCPGKTLTEALSERGRLEVADSLSILEQVAAALESAHSKGIIHRDIKPSNIIIDPAEQVKVTDFGIALVAGEERLTDSGLLAGSVRYVSPEQAKGEELDARSDIYSLGIVFYEMLAGTPPFDIGTPYAVLDRHIKEAPQPIREVRPGLPEDLSLLLDKMLAKERSERFADCTELLRAVRALKGEIEPSAEAEGVQQPRALEVEEMKTLKTIPPGQAQVRGLLVKVSKRTMRFALGLLLLVLGGMVWWMFVASKSEPGGLPRALAGDFISAGALEFAREAHTTTLLADGSVLVVGGIDNQNQPVAQCEIYEPESRSFRTGPTLSEPRLNHTTTRLVDGSVLIVGGERSWRWREALSSVEIYTPTGGLEMLEVGLATPRRRHRAILLHDGRVLITGGEDAGGETLASTEILDLDSRTFSEGPPLHHARKDHTLTLLANGREVLVVGGSDGKDDEPLRSAEVFEADKKGFREVGELNEPRYEHTATLLPDGRVLIAGGRQATSKYLRSIEVFQSGAFGEAGHLLAPRAVHTANLLQRGSSWAVLFVGGGAASPARECEIWRADGSVKWGPRLPMPRNNHTATLLQDGEVLIIGGYGYDLRQRLDSAEAYVIE